jgi:DNA/RNA-binding domain of Phe-tRNA-synthetase-like protein
VSAVIFQYMPEITAAYLNLTGGLIVGSGLRNGPTSEALRDEYRAEQAAVLARVGATPLSELPALAAWRRAFRSFGVDPTKYRSAAEALLRRLSKQGEIPTIDTLVDIGNLISIRYAMPVAVFNRAAIDGALSVHRAVGDEPYLTLHEGETDPPAPGEVIFTDVRRHVFARRWCWRQSDEGASRADTTDILVTIEALHAEGRVEVPRAVDEMRALLEKYAGGQYATDVLTPDRPALSA